MAEVGGATGAYSGAQYGAYLSGKAPERTAQEPANRSAHVVYLSAGASHTVALLSDQRLCAWGRGEDGQLGLGGAEEELEPVEVATLTGQQVSSVACGADHTTAYSKNTLTLWTWGWGDFGRLGHGHSGDVFVPHPVRSLCGQSIKLIACGDCHCIAILQDGRVYSWGRNQNGQLGLGTFDDVSTPAQITALDGIPMAVVAAGAEHTAAVSEDGRLYGWGWGRYGNLGLGDRSDRALPEQVTAVQNETMRLVACGWRHTIVVNTAGQLFTYGWSKYGQLGHGDSTDHLTPSPVASLASHTITQVSGGWRHSVALDSDGKLYSWGWNRFGQLGVGSFEDQNSPQPVDTIQESVAQVSCGWRHTVALTSSRNVFTWGRATSGQLGHGDTTDKNLPTKLVSLSADGDACRGVRSSEPPAGLSPDDRSTSGISAGVRYAVVPGEQTVPGAADNDDASVPDAESKRARVVE